MSLFAASVEFHTTNINRLKQSLRPTIASQPSSNRGYKAVVVLFLGGGADSYNFLVPHSGCQTTNGVDLHQQYNAIRGNIALQKSTLHTIQVPANSQPCSTFGLHRHFQFLKEAYDDGEAAMIANIGAMIQPTSKQEFESKSVPLPPGLFSHNVMVRSAETVHAQLPSAKGVVGRIADALRGQTPAYSTATYSTSGNRKILEGLRPPDILDQRKGVIVFEGYEELGSSIKQLFTANQSASIYGDTYTTLTDAALEKTNALGGILDNVTLSQNFPSTRVGRQLEQVSRVIASRGILETDRAGFVVCRGGFDSHNTAGDKLDGMVSEIDDALRKFAAEMKNLGVWDDVALVTVSDFARTMTSNGLGTDHGWGGNSFLLGGKVKGARIFGQFPSSFDDSSETNIGRGRILPTRSWEAMWHGLAEWMGVETSQMSEVLPNSANFNSAQLFSRDQLFHP